MKRLLIVLLGVLLMTACGNEEKDGPLVESSKQEPEKVNEQENEVITEVISEQDHNIVLSDNEDLKITLLNSKHERYENAKAKDKVELSLEIENKKNRTFNILADKLSLDGVETNSMATFFNESEIEPNEERVFILTTFTETYLDEFELNFKEHLSGRIIYSDYERSRLTIDFNEYINE